MKIKVENGLWWDIIDLSREELDKLEAFGEITTETGTGRRVKIEK